MVFTSEPNRPPQMILHMSILMAAVTFRKRILVKSHRYPVPIFRRLRWLCAAPVVAYGLLSVLVPSQSLVPPEPSLSRDLFTFV